MGSPACNGSPVHLDWLCVVSLDGFEVDFAMPVSFTALLGRVRQAVASIIPSGNKFFLSSQLRRSSVCSVKGCTAGVASGPVGVATRQVSAQTSSAGRPELVGVRMAGSQVACSRFIAATRNS